MYGITQEFLFCFKKFFLFRNGYRETRGSVLFVALRKNISDVSISFDSASCFLRPAGFSLRLISSCEAPHPS